MLVNLNDVLRPARQNHYAVGLFNAVNLELARGIIAAAEKRVLRSLWGLPKYYSPMALWKKYPTI